MNILWVCKLAKEAGTVNSSFYVRKTHWWWLSVTAVVSCLLTSHTWLWCCMHEICMFTWFALYCEIWVFLCIHSHYLFQSGYSWPQDLMNTWLMAFHVTHALHVKVMHLIVLLRTCHWIQFLQQLLFLTWLVDLPQTSWLVRSASYFS